MRPTRDRLPETNAFSRESKRKEAVALKRETIQCRIIPPKLARYISSSLVSLRVALRN